MRPNFSNVSKFSGPGPQDWPWDLIFLIFLIFGAGATRLALGVEIRSIASESFKNALGACLQSRFRKERVPKDNLNALASSKNPERQARDTYVDTKVFKDESE